MPVGNDYVVTQSVSENNKSKSDSSSPSRLKSYNFLLSILLLVFKLYRYLILKLTTCGMRQRQGGLIPGILNTEKVPAHFPGENERFHDTGD